MIYSFGDFELDDGLYQLRHGDGVVKLEPKVFDVLAHLVRHRDRVVSKDELLEALWPGEFVSESVLPRCVTAARKALGDTRRAPRFIATIHGRGYRFLVDATEAVSPAALEDASTSADDIFVGRAAAMTELDGALTNAIAGRGRLMLIAGEPGIGKTRTAEELAAIAARRGVRVAIGRCYEAEGTPAYWPWVQVLRTCVEQRDAARLRTELGPGAADIAELVPELRRQIPNLPSPPAIASPHARFRLFDSVAAFLRQTSSAQALLIILDDVHWADPSSLQMLQFVARDLRRARVLIVAAYRDVELGRQHPLAQVLGELAREPICQRLVLRGLELSDVQTFIERTAKGVVADTLVSAVYQMTEGNPFFIIQIMRWLAAEGRLETTADDSGWTIVLPQGVREVIGRRLNDLSEQCNEILALAAVIGREFHFSVLERVSGLDSTALLHLLDEAARARIVSDTKSGLGAYAFTHTLIRQTLYEELSAPRRVLLHGRIAEALEAIHRNDPEPYLAEIAHHFFQAAPGGTVDKAIAYTTRAAQRAARLLASEEAAEQYRRALQLWDVQALAATSHDAGVQRCEVLLGLGDAESVVGNRVRSQQICRQAADLARSLGRADLLARAALAFGQRAELGPLPAEELCHLLEEALEALGDSAGPLRARVLSRLAGTVPYQDSMETRSALSHQAVELAKSGNDPEALLDAFGARLWSLMGPDDDLERLRCTEELEALAQRGIRKEALILVHEHRLRCFLSAGDLSAADRESRAYEAVALELRQPVYLYLNGLYRVGRALGDGRFAAAEDEIEQTIALGERLEYPGTDALLIWQVYWMLRQQGREEELATTLVTMRERCSGARGRDRAAAAVADLPLTPEGLIARYNLVVQFQHAAVVYWQAATGHTQDAQRVLDNLAADGFKHIPRDESWLTTLTLLAEGCALVGNRAHAPELYALLEPFANHNASQQLMRTYAGSVSHFLGLLARTVGDIDTAARHFERALEMNARIRTPPALARTQYEYAALLDGRNQSGDRPHARELLAQAARMATDLGLAGLQDKITRARSGRVAGRSAR